MGGYASTTVNRDRQSVRTRAVNFRWPCSYLLVRTTRLFVPVRFVRVRYSRETRRQKERKKERTYTIWLTRSTREKYECFEIVVFQRVRRGASTGAGHQNRYVITIAMSTVHDFSVIFPCTKRFRKLPEKPRRPKWIVRTWAIVVRRGTRDIKRVLWITVAFNSTEH